METPFPVVVSFCNDPFKALDTVVELVEDTL
jgi:hypothetical protein